MRIALFTPFSPELGGGSAQLRSHLHYLPELDVRWYYLANQPAANWQGKWLGPQLTTTELLSDLSARTGFLPGSKSRIKNLVEQTITKDFPLRPSLSHKVREFISPFTTIPSAPGPVRNATACFARFCAILSRQFCALHKVSTSPAGACEICIAINTQCNVSRSTYT